MAPENIEGDAGNSEGLGIEKMSAMALSEFEGRSKHDTTPMRSAEHFRANYAAVEGGSWGGGRCSVEMRQENLISLLLKQQEEVLRELRDQKKVVCVFVCHDFGGCSALASTTACF